MPKKVPADAILAFARNDDKMVNEPAAPIMTTQDGAYDTVRPVRNVAQAGVARKKCSQCWWFIRCAHAHPFRLLPKGPRRSYMP